MEMKINQTVLAPKTLTLCALKQAPTGTLEAPNKAKSG